MSLSPDDMPTPQPVESRYEILEKLGAGGAGVVYKARDRETGAVVALKVLHAHIAQEPELLQSLKSELLLARKITHKNVCRVYDLNRLGDASAISMEYVEGESLRKLLKREGALPVESGLRLVRQVVAGIAEAHAEDVVHRDLKPENILISHEGVVKVMDFGVARSLETIATFTGRMSGTPHYMSPEQAQGKPYDARTDVYAIGLIMYEMFTGSMAFTGDTSISIALKQISDAPVPPRNIAQTMPEPLERIIMRCIEKAPEKRFQSMDELDAAICEYLDVPFAPTRQATVAKIPARPPSRIPSYVASYKRPRKLLWAALAGIFLVVDVVGIAWRMAPAKSTALPPTVRVLIADLENTTGDSVFDGTLEPMLGVALEGAPFVTVYNRAVARNRAAQLKPGATKLDEETGRLVAASDGLNDVITGSLAHSGSGYTLSIKVIDTFSGGLIVAKDATAKSKDGVLSAVASIATPIRIALGDATPEKVQRAAAETFTTASIEAIQAYVAAQDLQTVAKYEEAIRSYLLATQLDPEFGRAYAGMAISYANLNRIPEAEKYFAQALARIAKMTDREKYRTRGGYYYAMRNYRSAIDEYSKLLKEYPADGIARNNLAASFFVSRDVDKAIDEQRRAVAVYPKNAVMRYNLAQYGLYRGEFAAAVRDSETALQLNPAYLKAHVSLALSKLALGQMDQAVSVFTNMQTVSAGAASRGLVGLADIAIVQGRLKDAIATLNEGIVVNVANKDEADAARKRVMLAEVYLMLGQTQKAVAFAEQAAAVKDEAVLVSAARTLTGAGKNDRALSLMGDLVSTSKITNRAKAYSKLIEAEALINGAEFQRSVDVLYDALKDDDIWVGHYVLGRAYLEKGSFTEASSEFEKCLKGEGEAMAVFFDENPTFHLFPPVYYYLGRAQEGLHSPGAAESYQKFLSFQTSTENPLTIDAKKRLSSR